MEHGLPGLYRTSTAVAVSKPLALTNFLQNIDTALTQGLRIRGRVGDET
jgi:hypothetical protein